MADLQKEVWIAGIQENPIPNTSFVFASTDKSEYVENNKLHLAEAGIEPDVYENYFEGNENDLPLQAITDIPNEVVLKTYSTNYESGQADQAPHCGAFHFRQQSSSQRSDAPIPCRRSSNSAAKPGTTDGAR